MINKNLLFRTWKSITLRFHIPFRLLYSSIPKREKKENPVRKLSSYYDIFIGIRYKSQILEHEYKHKGKNFLSCFFPLEEKEYR
jgi:hypothetical protein